MAKKPFISVDGITVGEASGLANVILSNGDITTTNITISNNASLGNVGNVIITGGSSGYILSTNGSGNLSWIPQSGSNSTISNGNSNVNIPTANGNVNITASGNANILVVTGTGSNITGTLNVTGNANVGNIGATGVLATTLSGALTTAAQPNITSVGTLTSLSVTGNITSGNANLGNSVTANFFTGNGIYLTGITSTGVANGNSNISIPFANGNVNFSAVGNANILVITGTGVNVAGTADVTGNLTAGNITTGGGTGGNITGANYITANYFTGTLTTNAQPNITSVGTLTSLNVSGNANTGNLGTNNFIAIGSGSFGANVNLNTYWINNVGYPSANTDVATKIYVDTMVSSGISYHQPVVAATTTTLATATSGTVSYNNGTAGVGATLTTTGTFNLIDTANVQTVGTRILVKNEANAAWNGIYEYTSTTIITRTADADEYGADSTTQLSINDYFFTTDGSVNKGVAFVVSAPAGTIVFGTSNITFAQFSSSQVYTAGTGLTLTGTTFSVNASQTQITSVGTLTSLTATGNVTGGNLVTAGKVYSADFINGGTGIYLSAGPSGYINFFTTGGDKASISDTGNIVASNIIANSTVFATTANVSANVNAGNANLGNLVTANYFTGTLTTAAQPNITSTGTLVNLTVSGNVAFSGPNVSLGAVGNLKITGGTANYILKTDGTGNLAWIDPPGVNSANVTVDNFTGNGVQTIFTLSTTPIGINQTSVNYNGATVLRTDYSLTGANITFSSAPANGSYIEVTTINLISGSGGSSLTIQDEGSNLTTTASLINFVGNGISATNVGNSVTVTVNTSGGITAQDLLSPFLLMGA